jgi:hypothetical protein
MNDWRELLFEWLVALVVVASFAAAFLAVLGASWR